MTYRDLGSGLLRPVESPVPKCEGPGAPSSVVYKLAGPGPPAINPGLKAAKFAQVFRGINPPAPSGVGSLQTQRLTWQRETYVRAAYWRFGIAPTTGNGDDILPPVNHVRRRRGHSCEW